MKTFYISESKNVFLDKIDIGLKAYNLCMLYNRGIQVLDGLILPIQCFYECVNYNHAEQYIKEIYNNNSKSQFREIIKTFSLNPELLNMIDEMSKNISYPLIVRSSSILEDNDKKSMAGMYLSISDIKNHQQLINAILDVWSSAYYNCFETNVPLGIIIQPYIMPEFGGVLFSKHPLGKDCLYGEYSLHNVSDTVEGRENRIFQITYNHMLLNYDEFINPYVKELYDIILQIKKILELEVDIEWMVFNKKIYVLQARPITNYIHKKKVNDFTIIDVDDIEYLSKLDLSSIYQRYMKWFDKRLVLRNICKEHNIAIPRVKYIFYNKYNLNIDKIYNEFTNVNIFKIESSREIRTKTKCDLETYLYYLADILQEEIVIVRIQEITSTEYCGNACMTEDGNIYIECIPGGFGGFLSGELDYSSYLLNSNCDILDSRIFMYNFIWRMNHNTKKFQKTFLDRSVSGELSKECLQDIVYMTLIHDKINKNIKLEFEIEDNKAYFNDATFDQRTIVSDIMSERIISIGDFSGKIEFLSNEELNKLKDFFGERSVIAESEFIKKSNVYKGQKNTQLKQKKILVAPYPASCLSVLIDLYEGFIFTRGGILSHLAIILRECQKPAIINNNITNFDAGSYVNVVQGKINVTKSS